MKKITGAELKVALASAKPPFVLDVREPKEVQQGCIPNAKNIPLSILPFVMNQELPNKSMEIVVNCRSGGRSAQACVLLEKAGYRNVINLEGGYEAYCKLLGKK